MAWVSPSAVEILLPSSRWAHRKFCHELVQSKLCGRGHHGDTIQGHILHTLLGCKLLQTAVGELEAIQALKANAVVAGISSSSHLTTFCFQTLGTDLPPNWPQ